MSKRKVLENLKNHAHAILAQSRGEKDAEQVWGYALGLFQHELDKLDNDLYHLY